jgi:predicted RNA-binding Zn ribbon-like protein
MAVDVTVPRFYGGNLCLDFANTVEPRNAPAEREFLTGYDDLVAWAERAGLPAPSGVDPTGAADTYRLALSLREALYRIFAVGAEPADLAVLREVYLDGLRHADLRRDGDAFRWEYRSHPRRPLWLVAASAVELLRDPDALARVKVCPGTCGWLFLDTTKNGRRRWCSMSECGTGAKVRRQAERRQASRKMFVPGSHE